MRVWDIPAGYLNRQSLLAEHRELHGIHSILVNGKQGYSRHPETLRWVGGLSDLARRHEWLAAEMRRGGFVERTAVASAAGRPRWPEKCVTVPGEHNESGWPRTFLVALLRRVGTPGPRVLGLDEVSIKKGHTYRLVVSDLIRQRPIWFGGTDRSEASLDQFYAWLGPRKTTRIRLVVMDMWKPFRLATAHHAPQASILLDKFHILRHLGDALDEVRKRGSAASSRGRSTPCWPIART